MNTEKEFKYTPLPEPIVITEQEWPEGTLPLVHTRHMTFNQESYIKDCIEGVLMQKTTFPVQVLIHDDASTDKTAEIVREYELKYPKLIKAYYQKENSYSQPDKGKRREEFTSWRLGKYEAICEGDDYWTDPCKLQKQVQFLETNPDYGMVHSDFEYVDLNTKSIAAPSTLHASIKERVFNGYIWDYLLNNPGFILTLSCVFRISLFDPNFSKKWYAFDHWTFMEISRKSKVFFIPEKMCAYRINPKGMMLSQRSTLSYKLLFIKLDQILAYYDNSKYTENHYKNDPSVEDEIAKTLVILLVKFPLKDLRSRLKIVHLIMSKPKLLVKIPNVIVKLIKGQKK